MRRIDIAREQLQDARDRLTGCQADIDGFFDRYGQRLGAIGYGALPRGIPGLRQYLRADSPEYQDLTDELEDIQNEILDLEEEIEELEAEEDEE